MRFVIPEGVHKSAMLRASSGAQAMRIIGNSVLVSAVTLLLACGGGEGKPASHPSTGESTHESSSGMKFDNDCVDPVSDGDNHDPSRPADHHVQLDVREFDLDGDGEVDYFVKPAW